MHSTQNTRNYSTSSSTSSSPDCIYPIVPYNSQPKAPFYSSPAGPSSSPMAAHSSPAVPSSSQMVPYSSPIASQRPILPPQKLTPFQQFDLNNDGLITLAGFFFK